MVLKLSPYEAVLRFLVLLLDDDVLPQVGPCLTIYVEEVDTVSTFSSSSSRYLFQLLKLDVDFLIIN